MIPSLALGQVIVLDEPFTGLDSEAAASVAKELQRLRSAHGTALLLISHEPDIVALLMRSGGGGNRVVTIDLADRSGDASGTPCGLGALLWGTGPGQRFARKLADYLLWSLPLVLLALAAAGLAVALLTADLLRRVDVTDPVIRVLDKEVKPMLKLLTGEESNPMMLMMIKMQVRKMLDSTVPPAKAAIYAAGMAKLFTLEVGPLLTALLLCGRLGGSYAGEVASMQASHQNKLLRTLGMSPVAWSFAPAMAAALVAGPVLTVAATSVAVLLGAVPLMGPLLSSPLHDPQALAASFLGSPKTYLAAARDAVLPPWVKVPPWSSLAAHAAGGGGRRLASCLLEGAGTAAVPPLCGTLYEAAVEIATYPPVFLVSKSLTYAAIIMGTAEVCARTKPDLTPRGVPRVITAAVVGSGLLVILADWAFSQLLLLRTW